MVLALRFCYSRNSTVPMHRGSKPSLWLACWIFLQAWLKLNYIAIQELCCLTLPRLCIMLAALSYSIVLGSSKYKLEDILILKASMKLWCFKVNIFFEKPKLVLKNHTNTEPRILFWTANTTIAINHQFHTHDKTVITRGIGDYEAGDVI